MHKVGVVGASGYAGGELVRLLSRHPSVKVEAIGSRTHRGKPLGQIFPSLLLPDLPLKFVSPEDMDDCHYVFLAVPHGASSKLTGQMLDSGRRVIDIAADFRLKDPREYEAWYGAKHEAPQLIEQAVYGLPEIHRGEIGDAHLIANPGCYPTSAVLGLAPLMHNNVAETEPIIIDSLSGVSGAGRKEAALYHFPHCSENLLAYGIGTHRHTPEIEQELALLSGKTVKVMFTPHLVPVTRGILTTITVRLKRAMPTQEILGMYRDFYAREYFVRILKEPSLPQTKWVAGSNFCDIGVRFDSRTERAVVVVAIDNLGKGAASQAIQNMNIMAGFEETTGIDGPAIYP